jgi:photosystem II stability/assembly factor-like uncharacterized protein
VHPLAKLPLGVRPIPRCHSTSRNLAVGAVAVVALVAAAVCTGTWAGLLSSGSRPPAALGSIAATASAALTPTRSHVPQNTVDGPALETGEHVIDMGPSASGGWLLTQVRLLLDEGSGWRNCWLSGAGPKWPGGSIPGLQAFFFGDVIRVRLSATLWTSTDGCASWSSASIPVDPIDLAFPTASVGYLIGGDKTLAANPTTTIFKTVDGGLHWKATGTAHIALGPAPLISFADADHGWVTDGLSVWTTATGGASWARTALPTPPSLKGDPSWLTKSIDGDGSAIIAATYDTTYGMGGVPLHLVFYRTLDFGKHWEAASVLEVEETTELSVVDSETWVTLDPSEPATVRTTTDAGSAWRTVAVGHRWPFLAGGIHFADTLHGWLVVTEPYPVSSQSPGLDFGPAHPQTQHLVVTDDGGDTWTQLRP